MVKKCEKSCETVWKEKKLASDNCVELEFDAIPENEGFARGNSYRSYQMLVGVIYVALAGYISQDIMKANIAYDYGMRILKWILGRED